MIVECWKWVRRMNNNCNGICLKKRHYFIYVWVLTNDRFNSPGAWIEMKNSQDALWFRRSVATYVMRWFPIPNLAPGKFDLNICLSWLFDRNIGSFQKTDRWPSFAFKWISIFCGQYATSGKYNFVNAAGVAVLTVITVRQIALIFGLFWFRALNVIVWTPAPKCAFRFLAHAGWTSMWL